jgi:uncharacterized OB-fold protein
MNKSEVQEKSISKNMSSGWVCPKCGRVLSPEVRECPCSKAKQENAQIKKNWIND